MIGLGRVVFSFLLIVQSLTAFYRTNVLSVNSCTNARHAKADNRITHKKTSMKKCPPIWKTNIGGQSTSDLAGKDDSPNTQENPLDEGDAAKAKNMFLSYTTLAVLLGAFVSNQWSRQALFYLCDFGPEADPFRHINIAIGFSKESYAALASFGFTLVFAIVSLFSGNVADRFGRDKIAAISCAVWSIATAMHAFAGSFAQLVPLRAIVGASQAFFTPTAYTLLADIFPKTMLASVNGIFSGGIYLGGALSSLSIIVDYQIGWQKTMLFIGAAGLVMAGLCYTLINEPRAPGSPYQLPSSPTNEEGGTTAIDTVDEKQTFSSLVSDACEAIQDCGRPYQAKLLYSAAILRFCAGFSIGIWKAPFIFEKFAGSEMAFSSGNALILAVGGFSSGLIGGYLSDYLSNPRNPAVLPRGRSWVPAVGSLFAAPLWCAFVTAGQPETAALYLFFEYLVAECWFGPTLAALFATVPPNRRGAAQSLFSLATAAGNFGPVVVGSLASRVNADFLKQLPFAGDLGISSLGLSLLLVVAGAYTASAVMFALVAIEEDKDIRAKFNIDSKKLL